MVKQDKTHLNSNQSLQKPRKPRVLFIQKVLFWCQNTAPTHPWLWSQIFLPRQPPSSDSLLLHTFRFSFVAGFTVSSVSFLTFAVV